MTKDAADNLLTNDVIKFTPELDEALNQFTSKDDELDTSEFSNIDYINNLFPTEESIGSIDQVLLALRQKITKLDLEIEDKLRNQTDAGTTSQSELLVVKKAILDLMAKIKTISENSAQTEQMVHEITKDIKSFDQAKRNLTTSITVLKRLQMISSALDQLTLVSSKKQYVESSQLLAAILQLLVSLASYKAVPQIKDLFDRATAIQNELKKMILRDFDEGFVNGQLRISSSQLKNACMVVDVFEFDARKNVVEWYCEMQLKDYKTIFRNNPEVAGLADVSRRFAWIKRLLKLFDDEHANCFPQSWKVAEYLCEKFCVETKKDLGEVLGRLDATRTIDVKVMLTALSSTMDFESKLDLRFGIRDLATVDFTTEHVIDSTSRFYRIIASCFAPYLEHYTHSENAALLEMMEHYRSQPVVKSEDGLIASCTDLFYAYRQTMVQFARFSTGKPFLDLGKMFGKHLKSYAEMLMSKLPKEERKVISEEEIKLVSIVVNTADYCSSTTAQLEEKIMERINEQFRNLVNFSIERDEFVNVTSAGIKILVRGIINCLDGSLYNMTKLSWSAVESVGDQSDYVSSIATTLLSTVTSLKNALGGPKFFKTFCDKFADAFLAKFETNIYKCKPISEVGAEQMLLDTHALRTILVQMTNIGQDTPSQPPMIYMKLLAKGVSRVEMLLKTIMIPSEPADGLVDRYMMMYAGEVSVTGFQKILDLKGLRRADQQGLIDVLQQKLSGFGSTLTVEEVTKKVTTPLLGTKTEKLKDDMFKFFKKK